MSPKKRVGISRRGPRANSGPFGSLQIKPLVIERDPWRLRHLTDDSEDVEVEEGKLRGRAKGASTVGYATFTPEAFRMIAKRPDTAEPYVWDQLLLDARDLLPDIGSATVMAFAALENFIGWASAARFRRRRRDYRACPLRDPSARHWS